MLLYFDYSIKRCPPRRLIPSDITKNKNKNLQGYFGNLKFCFCFVLEVRFPVFPLLSCEGNGGTTLKFSLLPTGPCMNKMLVAWK